MEQKLAQLQAKIEADPSMIEKLFALESSVEVQSSLKEQGIDFTLEEIDVLRELIVKGLEQGASDELSDDQLENVAGGFVITAGILTGIAAIITAVGGAVGVAGGVVDNAVRSRW